MTALALVPQAPTLDSVLALVLDTTSSQETRRHYRGALVEFLAWRARRALAFNRASVQAWRTALEAEGYSPSSINLRLSAVRKLAREAAANGYLDGGSAASINQVPNARQTGNRMGNWLTQAQAQALILAPDPNSLKGVRDRCALALLVGCGLRRNEAAQLTFEHIQERDGRFCIVDIRGKRGRIRTVPVPAWVKMAIDGWKEAAQLTSGRILRAVSQSGITASSLSAYGVFQIAAHYGEQIGLRLGPHDLRRTCAKLCRKHGGKLEQIQLLLGHQSIQTTERYLGTEQDLANAPNDRLGLKWREE
jgi:integrase